MLKITKPTLLVNKEIARNNISRMSKKASQSQVEFRPHFKTHFSAEIGEWYRRAGITKITVSSIDMAVYFAKNGWNDITIAFPVNILEIDTLNDLAGKIQLNLVVESVRAVEYLSEKINSPINIFIKIDTGYGRTGMNYSQPNEITAVINNIKGKLHFKGLLAHFGHTYKLRDSKKINAIHNEEVKRLNELKEVLNIPDAILSIGDTPSCSVVDEFRDIDEIRPGNFVFYDQMQLQIGSCTWQEIAVCMACPVVAIHKDRNEIIVHGGAVHFSKDHLKNENGSISYGNVVELGPNGWIEPYEQVYVKSLSQEHGKIHAPDEFISKITIGSIIGVIPVHSCLTANLMKDYFTLNGEKITTMNSID